MWWDIGLADGGVDMLIVVLSILSIWSQSKWVFAALVQSMWHH